MTFDYVVEGGIGVSDLGAGWGKRGTYSYIKKPSLYHPSVLCGGQEHCRMVLTRFF